MYYVTIIQPSGEVTTTHQPAAPDYTQLQSAVGGLIETVPYFDTYKKKPCVAFCNEEGKLEGLEFNLGASIAWSVALGVPFPAMVDYLVGPVCIVSADTRAELREL